MTERLEIVNAALAATGVAPVSTYDSQHPDVAPVDVVITKVSKQVQLRGWWFNKDYKLSLSPDSNGRVTLPSTTLAVDPSDSTSPYVRRGKYLYDPVAHTFNIGKDVEVDIVFLLDIDELPESAGSYILEKVVHEFYVNDDGDLGKAAKIEQRAYSAWIALKAEELNNSDVNSNYRPASLRMRAGINPSTGLGVSSADPTYVGGGN